MTETFGPREIGAPNMPREGIRSDADFNLIRKHM
jgi:hypothetical protein